MSEQGAAAPDAAPQQAGALLRQARERAGLHIAALAATLKVPVQRLEALEQGRHDALPDATFARALALSVCRVLKIDPAPVLAALPIGQTPNLGPSSGAIDAPMPRETVTPGFGGGEPGGRRTPLWIALALVVLAVVLWFVLPADGGAPVPLIGGGEAPVAASSPASSPAPGGLAPDTPPPPAAPTAPVVPAAPMPPVPAAPAGTGASAPPVTPPPVLAAPAPAAAAGPSSDAGVLELRVQATSWVQVTGASGRVWLQRSLQPGEVVRFDEDLPLAVTVGRADATDVSVRGQPFDLAPVTRNNVARFEIR